MPVRLVALDLDGTLVDTRTLEIAEADATTLRRVAERGVPVVLATARWPASARQFQRALQISGPLICHNGALVLDAEGGEVVRLAIDPDVARRIVRAAIALDLYPTPVVDDVLYGRPRPDQAPGRLDLSRAFHEMHLELVEDLESIISRGPMDVGVIGQDASAVGALLAAVSAEPVAVYRYIRDGELRSVIFQHPRASKGEAVRSLCERLGVPLAGVLAIGDSEADVPMLEVAGIAVAPGDAPDDVRRVADWIAPPHGNGSVAAALERFVLQVAAT